MKITPSGKYRLTKEEQAILASITWLDLIEWALQSKVKK